MTSRCSFQCFEKPGELEPYPDIGGPGVVTGFLGTAWFVVFLVLLRYLLAFDPAKDPFQRSETNDSQGASLNYRVWTPNYIDQLFLESLETLTAKFRRHFPTSQGLRWLIERPRWDQAFTKVVLAMCDIQILTGLGILLSGYIDLFCFISAYHWQLIVYLAWFSNLTHMACLVALRGYLHLHQRERNLRLIFMTLLWLGLVPAILPTAFFNWAAREPSPAVPASNARCFFDFRIPRSIFNRTACFDRVTGNRLGEDEMIHFGDGDYYKTTTCYSRALSGTAATQSAITSLLLLGFSYCTRCIKLLKPFSDSVRRRVRKTCSDRLVTKWTALRQRSMEDPDDLAVKRRERVKVEPMMALYLTGKLYADLLTSDLSDVYWLIVSAVWGTMRFTEARSSATVNDNDWGFGQILPVFLLIGPIIATIQYIAPVSEHLQTAPGTAHSQQGNRDEHVNVTSLAAYPDTTSDDAPGTHGSEVEGSVPLETLFPVTDPNGTITQHVSASLEAPHIHPQRPGFFMPSIGLHDVDSKALLRKYATESPGMRGAVVLASAQVIPLTIMIFTNIKVSAMTTMELLGNFASNALGYQPLNCFLFILLVISQERSASQTDIGGNRSLLGRLIRAKYTWVTILFSVLIALDLVSLTYIISE
ncbi:hypothetical protein QBC43DRAFT_353749 [Cladorrhinum sp. PSN259]|nr:hypothetical protein QBC43DRAFT_353749 [Cladorrhinum sp. PSN259]